MMKYLINDNVLGFRDELELSKEKQLKPGPIHFVLNRLKIDEYVVPNVPHPSVKAPKTFITVKKTYSNFNNILFFEDTDDLEPNFPTELNLNYEIFQYGYEELVVKPEYKNLHLSLHVKYPGYVSPLSGSKSDKFLHVLDGSILLIIIKNADLLFHEMKKSNYILEKCQNPMFHHAIPYLNFLNDKDINYSIIELKKNDLYICNGLYVFYTLSKEKSTTLEGLCPPTILEKGCLCYMNDAMNICLKCGFDCQKKHNLCEICVNTYDDLNAHNSEVHRLNLEQKNIITTESVITTESDDEINFYVDDMLESSYKNVYPQFPRKSGFLQNIIPTSVPPSPVNQPASPLEQSISNENQPASPLNQSTSFVEQPVSTMEPEVSVLGNFVQHNIKKNKDKFKMDSDQKKKLMKHQHKTNRSKESRKNVDNPPTV